MTISKIIPVITLTSPNPSLSSSLLTSGRAPPIPVNPELPQMLVELGASITCLEISCNSRSNKASTKIYFSSNSMITNRPLPGASIGVDGQSQLGPGTIDCYCTLMSSKRFKQNVSLAAMWIYI